MSVIVGISPRSDHIMENVAYRLLVELAYPRATNEDDRRVLNAGLWTHFVDLTHLEREQARRIAWLLDGAARSRIDEWRAQGGEPGATGVTGYERLQVLLRKTFGREPKAIPIETEPQARVEPVGPAEGDHFQSSSEAPAANEERDELEARSRI